MLRHDRSKSPVALSALVAEVGSALERTTELLYDEALAFRMERTTTVDTVEEAIEAGATGFAVLPWSAVGDAGEDRLAEAGITVRCLQLSLIHIFASSPSTSGSSWRRPVPSCTS